MAGSEDDIPPPPPPPPSQIPTQQTPHTISTIKLPILKKGEYDIWAMKMEHYLAYTDYPIWEVIQRGNGPVSVSTDTNGLIKVLPPKTAEEILARERERKARTTLLMALPEDHLAKFHKMTDAKEMWEAIKSRFGGNDESKKMQKYILKQQFEGFSVSNSEGLHKGYDRFQSLLSQLEIHGAGVSTEDANQKFLRSLPSAWSQVSLIMRTKPGVDSLSFDDLYNNLRVFESDVKGSTASSSSTQNVALVESYNLMPRNRLVLTKPKSSAIVVTTQGILLEISDPRGIKIIGGEMLRTLGIRIKKIGGDLVNRRTLRLCSSGSVTEMSARDKAGLGYCDQMNKVPPLMIGIYIPSGPDKEIDDSQFTYGPKQSKPSESDARSSDFNTCESNCSKETHESMPEPAVNEPKVVSQPKVWSDAPIIEEYDSDSEDEHVFLPTKEQETPSFAFINTVKHVKTPR
ncbi:hypothetical protein Tco_1108829 [Tanacetum coccineum]